MARRIISFILSLTMLLAVVPPTTANAAKSRCTSDTCDSCNVECTFNPKSVLTWGDKLEFSGRITSDSNIQKVTVKAFDIDNPDKYVFQTYTKQSVGSKSFKLSNVPDFTAGESKSKNWDGVTIVIYVVLSNETGVHHEFEYDIEFEDLDTTTISSPDEDDTFYAGDDITFKWGSVSGAEEFEWEFYEGIRSSGHLLDSGSTGTTSTKRKVVIDGDLLKAGKAYSFYVRATNDYSDSNWEWISLYAYAKPSELYADPEELSFTKDGGYDYIDLTSSHDWTATVSDGWIKLSDDSGTGDEEIKVTVSANTGASRVGVITFKSEVGTIYVNVIQAKGEASKLDVSTTRIQTSYEKGYESFSVTSNLYDWKVSSNVDWLSVTSAGLDLNDNVKISVDENKSIEPRTGTITVSGGGITKTVTVTQDGRLAIVGDINNDGEITNKDRFLLNRYLAGMDGYTDIDKILADINGDGSVNATDAEYLSRHLAGWAGYEKLPEINTGTSSCAHTQYTDTYYNTVYVSDTIKTNTTHTYYHVYNRKCSCGVDIGKVQGELITEAHSYVNNLCACGAYNDASYEKWTGVNVSDAQANVYSTPSATVRYGYINKNEVVTVIGEYGEKYLIEYTLDSGNGVKQGYVNKSCVEKRQPYSIYIDDGYFIEDVDYYDAHKLLVAEYGTVYSVKIHNLFSNTYEDYGDNGVVIESSNTGVVDINNNGQLTIKGVGRAQLFLKYNGELQDIVDVFGCDYWTLVNNDDILDHEFSPAKEDGLCCIAGKVNMFEYNSIYVSDLSKEGVGYHSVTFNLYNSSPATFSVMVYNKDGTVYDQKLIAAHSEGGMFDQMWVHLSNINDIWNGDMLNGKSETMSTKTSIKLDVPLGGAVCITSGSDYAFKENVVNLILMILDTFGGLNEISGDIGTGSIDVDVFYKKIADKLKMPEIEFTAKILEILSDKDDVGDAVTAILGMIFDEEEGIKFEDVAEIFVDSLMNVPVEILEEARDKIIDVLLKKIPAAGAIVHVTDTICAGGGVYLLIRAMRQYNDFSMHLIIHYSTTPRF